MNIFRAEGKLPAFTVLELLTGMIVSAIVLAALFTAYHIVSRQAQQYSERSSAYVAQSLLHSRLTRDVLSADSILFTPAGLECYRHDQTLRYTVSGSVIIRACNEQRDTFWTDANTTEEFFIPHERDQH